MTTFSVPMYLVYLVTLGALVAAAAGWFVVRHGRRTERRGFEVRPPDEPKE